MQARQQVIVEKMDSEYYIGELAVSAELNGIIALPRTPKHHKLLRSSLQRALPHVKLLTRSGSILLSTPVSEEVLHAANDLRLHLRPGVERFIKNRIRASTANTILRQQVEQIKSGGARLARTLLPDLSGIHDLDDHQIVNVAAMTLKGGYGLSIFDEQGAGKTVTFIHAFDLLVQRDDADMALIVAPKSMIAEWPKDFAKFKNDLYKIAILTGSQSEKSRLLSNGADVYVTNFETVVAMEQEIRSLLARYENRAVLVVDESFFIKNPEAKRTQALRRLREWVGRAFVLCGTPAPNSPHDIIEQMNFVDFGTAFESLPRLDEIANAESKIRSVLDTKALYVRHLKATVLRQLPKKEFHRIVVPLQPRQQEIYTAVLSELIEELQRTTDAQFKKNIGSFLARRTALLQTCSHPGSIVSAYSEVPAKLLALDNLLHDLIGKQGEKVIIWSFFKYSIDKIMHRYQQFKPARYDGSVPNVQIRGAAVQDFQTDSDTMLFVANPAAAGAGLTLHRSKYAVYESLSNQPAQYLQSLDRIHRRGQTRTVEYLILLGKDTIEVQDFARLGEKERNAQRLLRDVPEPPITRESMLREAQAAAILL
ncbi:MAG TPA: DEAD/DEAH box helicase [Candidatus Angelobacter sp.]|nr:DEAD/DEAH box helicase [Candidatus Angelobacter sp.]